MYDIQASGIGMPAIPVTDLTGTLTPNYAACSHADILFPIGTPSAPITVWEGKGGYIKSTGNIGGGLYGIPWLPFFDTGEPHQGSMFQSSYIEGTTKLFLYAAITGEDLEHANLGVYWSVEDDFSDVNFESQYNRQLYFDTWENALSDVVTEERAWDESPDADGDPTNMNPQGGEYADTDPFGFGNDDIDLPQTIQEMDYSGFINAYKIDNGGLFALAGGIFSNDTWTTLKNKFNGVGNPIDYIVSAIEIPYSAAADATKNFNLGGVDIVNGNGANVPLPYFTHRYEKLSFGSLTLKETWGTEKDYSTTNVSIYLPYVGVKDLDTGIIMNSTITLSAILDIWSGDLLYVIKINNKSMAYKYLASSGLVYRFQGNCGKQIPIGKVDNSNQLMAMTGSMASMGVGLVTGNPMAALGGAAGLIGSAAMAPKVSMAGGITGAIGRGDTDEPYLIISQSVPKYPADWRAHFGAPRYQTFTLNTLTGYVKCSDVHADSIEGANDAERAAIEQTLKAGVFMS